MGKRLYFLRHFRTRNNLNGVINGRSVDLEIMENPIIECEISFDKVFCSNAKRCKQTLEQLTNKCEIKEVIYTNMVLERNLGKMEGLERKIAIKRYNDIFIGDKLSVFSTPPEGESFRELYERAKEFWVSCENENGNILVCSHNQFLKMLSFIVLKEQITEESWKMRNFPFGEVVEIINE